ncbi:MULTISPECIES: DUF3311 domain-containing protein [Actinomadura]|uniref:DUF3311 domain-containing protein n=1 Tax=Actinomadura yumaensis TaxID=111807 RepID=A0ABW2CZE2_9ACTN|nr:DUF3311 domain-containing protein [Actinomadura sp. J1-007]MWK40217.1 DUF3311 domain-containing protein [Actinomadura sp. J1-007]
MSTTPRARVPAARRAAAGVLLAVPFAVYLAVPSYAREDPRIAGFPFFYWWQLVWVVLTAACIGGSHLLTRTRARPEPPAPPAGSAGPEGPAGSERGEEE